MLNSLLLVYLYIDCFDSRKQTKDELNNENHETKKHLLPLFLLD